MEIILFTLVAILLYLIADKLLRFFEARRGEPLPHRSLIFFVLLLTLALLSFNFLDAVLAPVE